MLAFSCDGYNRANTFLFRRRVLCQRLVVRCHELRIVDAEATWRILYYVDDDAVVILEVFSKKTRTTPKRVLDSAKARLKKYLRDVEEG